MIERVSLSEKFGIIKFRFQKECFLRVTMNLGNLNSNNASGINLK